MPAPLALTPYVKRFANPVLIHLAGWGWFVELEHVGRRSGTTLLDPAAASRLQLAEYYRTTYAHKPEWQGL